MISVTNLHRGVPKGNYREDIKKSGNMANVDLKRNMTAEEVKMKISDAFCK